MVKSCYVIGWFTCLHYTLSSTFVVTSFDQTSFLGKRQWFSKLRKLNPYVSQHVQSPGHQEASRRWKKMCMHLKRGATIDHDFQQELKQNASSMIFFTFLNTQGEYLIQRQKKILKSMTLYRVGI